MVGQALSDHSIRQFEPTLLQQIDTFLKNVLKQSKASSPMNMTPACRHLGLDVIGQLGFGYDLALQTKDEHRFLKDAIVFSNFRINLSMHIRTRLLAVVKKMIVARLAQPVDAKHDLLSFIAPKLETDLKEVQEGELWPEAVFFSGAGGDTTATALAGAFFYLSRNPDCYRKLAAEIRSTFTSADEIHGGRQLASCRYLRAYIDESLRMASPVPTTLWREQDPSEDGRRFLIVDGHVIPRGTLVGINIYSLHHNEKYFPNAFTFRPERWLENNETTRAAFIPFSVGSRTCAGKPLAYHEISLTLAKTLWYFDFEPAPGALGKVGGGNLGRADGKGRKDKFQLHEIFGAYNDGPYLTFHPRAQHWEELIGDGN
ncbi:hypothetical protein DL767_007379 [Monosporascus sp. MG133]|nr:hypothetical protein DL767_007379 [Monosporascus sp. MG133]